MASSSNSELQVTPIFFSCTGLDTHKMFAVNLYDSVKREGFHICSGDCKFELKKAIGNSRMSIILLSKNYANSTFCLSEIQTILDHHKKSGHLILPVFYEAEPWEIKKQAMNLDFGKKKVTAEEVKEWSAALKEVANMAGMVSAIRSNWCEEDNLITKIVRIIKKKLACNHPRVVYHEPKCISPNGEFKRNIKYWQKGNYLGSGSCGAVYEGLTDDGFAFAVKEVSLLDEKCRGGRSIFQIEQEISLLSQFKHENIVRYFGRDTDDSKLYIFLELVTEGSLSNLYQNYNLGDSEVSFYTRQILNGLNYLHCRNVVHRDIKCANILVDASGSVKIADFGLAKVAKLNDLKSLQGTAFWMAPEVVNQKNHQGYGLAADIWSLGCTVLEMLTRKIPYSPKEWFQALFQIGQGELPHVPTFLSENAQNFIFRCLQVNPINRPTAAQLLDDPFVNCQVHWSPPSQYYNGKGKKALTGLW